LKAVTRAAVTTGPGEPAAPGLSLAEGLKAGLPIAVGYIPIAVAFGLMAKAAGIPNHITILMSLAVFAGASQFAGVGLMASGAAPWEIVAATFILNLRHLIMSASISRRIGRGPLRRWMPLIAFGLTDETFSVASFRQEGRISPEYLSGLNLMAFTAWNGGTWAGVFLARGLPDLVRDGMVFSLYAMFIGLLVPSLIKSRPLLAVSVLAAAIHSVIYWVPHFQAVSAGWAVIIATLAAAAMGAYFFPGEVDQ